MTLKNRLKRPLTKAQIYVKLYMLTPISVVVEVEVTATLDLTKL